MNKLMKFAIMTGAIIMGTMPLAFARFNDLEEENLYTKAIYNLVEKGIMNGYPDNTFRSSKKITRAEFSKIIVIAENLVNDEDINMNFKDVMNHWAKEYISTAFSEGLIKGYEDNTFKPEKEITYGEAATILLRNLNLEDKLNSELSWPENYMTLASELGLFNGVATNDLIAINPARRDNVALMVWNYLNLENSKEDDKVDSETDKEEQENQEEISKPVSTKKENIGIVEKVTLRRGIKYVTVRYSSEKTFEVELYSESAEPEVHSVVIYTIASNGKFKLKKQVTIENVQDDFKLVEDVDEELVKLQGEDKLLDLDLDEYIYDGEKIKFEKYVYYLVDVFENKDGNYEFGSFEKVEKMNLKEKDKLAFDTDVKIGLIIRGLED